MQTATRRSATLLYFLHVIDRTTILRLEMAVDVILPIPESIHRSPMAKGLHLLPHLGVALLDPSLDPALPLNVGSGVIPIAEAICCQCNSRERY